MSSGRPVGWVSTLLYGAVLVAGCWSGLVGLGDTRPVPFLAGLAALVALDVGERRRYPVGTPRGPAVALLAARVALIVVVAAADGSGVARVLFVLAPLTAYFAFGRRVSVGVAVACGLLLVAAQIGTARWYADPERVSDLLMGVVGLVLAVAVAAVAADERAGRARLAESNARLRAYAERVAELSAERERGRLARDLHDGLGDHLTAISILLEQAEAFAERDPALAARALADARRSTRDALADVRGSVRALAVTPPVRLAAALAELAGRTGDAGPAVTVRLEGDEDGVDPPVLAALHRVAQEGLTNARRHARAHRVTVTVELGAASARLTVADDGCGFPPGREGFGLLGVRERARLLGGDVEVDTRPGAGTRLVVTLPAGGSR